MIITMNSIALSGQAGHPAGIPLLFHELARLGWGLAVGVFLASFTLLAAEAVLTGDHIATPEGDLIIHPINHATLALGWMDKIIYVDPVGGSKRFQGLPHPDLVLITDIHADHLDVQTLTAVASSQTVFVAPPEVMNRLPASLRSRSTELANNQAKSVLGLMIEAVPAYNLTTDRLQYHPKGRGNGYVLTLGPKRIYLSGDTEDTPEMRALKNIDVAFLCMNLPYTMNVKQAAEAVRAFHPKIVYPDHYRGSDLEQFKKLVGTDSGVEVRIRDWYAP